MLKHMLFAFFAYSHVSHVVSHVAFPQTAWQFKAQANFGGITNGQYLRSWVMLRRAWYVVCLNLILPSSLLRRLATAMVEIWQQALSAVLTGTQCKLFLLQLID